MTEDLAGEFGEALGDRPARAYPALVSTEADAVAWARAGGPEGAVVVADYQASARGRGGVVWEVRPGRTLAFSLLLRPELPVEREGWLYTVGTSGLADALEGDPEIAWPDEVHDGGTRVGAVGCQVELGPDATTWAVLNVYVPGAEPPRGPLLRRIVDAIEARYHEEPEGVLATYRPRCRVLGKSVRARLTPLGPNSPSIDGEAVDVLDDGALVIATERGSRVGVRPQHLGELEEA